MTNVGKWAFIAGLIIAAVAGLGFEASWLAWILALLGLVVGLMNITGDETQGFLLAAIGLMLSATAVVELPFVGELATRVMANLVAFIAPALLVVALRTLFQTARQA